MLKQFIGLAMLALVVSLAPQAHAVGFEVAIGAWQQSFGGTMGYNIVGSDDIIDIDNDMDFDEETRIFGRAKVEFPLAIPNIYVVAAPMQFEGTGSKSVTINYGGLRNIPADADLESEMMINQYDVALFWGLPFLKMATAGTFNIDLGFNVRWVDLEANLHATETTSNYDEEEDVSLLAPIPMLYVAFQITPVESFAIEAEGRGVSVGDNKLYSLIGRVRYKFPGPVFVAGGYRFDKLEIDVDDVIADIEFSGPFMELGIKF